ncbi:MAG TPA: TetR/AcrR family transcriptional regulator [Candidatus Methylacidiphilales bacterium]
MSLAAPSPTPKREALRQRIMAAADGLCRRLGYDKMNVAGIAAEVGISPAYVYKFFPSKRAIIQSCAERSLAEKKERVLAALRTKTRAADRLEAVARAIYQVHAERIRNEKHLYQLVVAAHRERWPGIRYFREFLLKTVADIVEEGVRRKEFRPVDPLDTARLLLDSLAWVTSPLLHDDLDTGGIEERIAAQIRFLEKALR